MYIGKNFVGAGASVIIGFGAMFALYFLDGESWWGFGWDLVTYGGVASVAFAMIYFVLRKLDKTYAQQTQSRVDRILTSLDDRELDVLRDRLSGAPMTDGEYGSLDDLMIENAAKPKRR